MRNFADDYIFSMSSARPAYFVLATTELPKTPCSPIRRLLHPQADPNDSERPRMTGLLFRLHHIRDFGTRAKKPYQESRLIEIVWAAATRITAMKRAAELQLVSPPSNGFDSRITAVAQRATDNARPGQVLPMPSVVSSSSRSPIAATPWTATPRSAYQNAHRNELLR